MIAFDTNLLVRVLVDDPQASQQIAQARAVAERFQQAYIPQPVQIELVWVLETAYEFTKEAVVGVLERLATNQALILQNEAHFQAALDEYKPGKADFADYLILLESRAKEATLVTFDNKLARSKDVNTVAAVLNQSTLP